MFIPPSPSPSPPLPSLPLPHQHEGCAEDDAIKLHDVGMPEGPHGVCLLDELALHLLQTPIQGLDSDSDLGRPVVTAQSPNTCPHTHAPTHMPTLAVLVYDM